MKNAPRSLSRLKYRRVLLKLSGEAFTGRGALGLNEKALDYAVAEIKTAHDMGVETALVIGGGNFLRGSQAAFLERAVADQLGMLATVMNSLALADVLSKAGVEAQIQSAVSTPWTDPIQPSRAKKALSRGDVVIYAGGTGNPFVTTDTAAAIRAGEISADALLKATQVDGIYSADPMKSKTARRFATISFDEAMEKNLAVMDMAAFDLCRQNQMTIVVFDFYRRGNLKRVVLGKNLGTSVS